MQTLTAEMERVENELVERARADYRAHLGKTLLVSQVRTFDEADNHVWITCEPPARVRVIDTPDDAIARGDGEWIDPYWAVELVEPHPELSPYAHRLLEVDGFSYEVASGNRHDLETWVLAPEADALAKAEG